MGSLSSSRPEGHRHPEGLGEAKDGLAFIATKSRRSKVIIPTAIFWCGRLE